MQSFRGRAADGWLGGERPRGGGARARHLARRARRLAADGIAGRVLATWRRRRRRGAIFPLALPPQVGRGTRHANCATRCPPPAARRPRGLTRGARHMGPASHASSTRPYTAAPAAPASARARPVTANDPPPRTQARPPRVPVGYSPRLPPTALRAGFLQHRLARAAPLPRIPPPPLRNHRRLPLPGPRPPPPSAPPPPPRPRPRLPRAVSPPGAPTRLCMYCALETRAPPGRPPRVSHARRRAPVAAARGRRRRRETRGVRKHGFRAGAPVRGGTVLGDSPERTRITVPPHVYTAGGGMQILHSRDPSRAQSPPERRRAAEGSGSASGAPYAALPIAARIQMPAAGPCFGVVHARGRRSSCSPACALLPQCFRVAGLRRSTPIYGNGGKPLEAARCLCWTDCHLRSISCVKPQLHCCRHQRINHPPPP